MRPLIKKSVLFLCVGNACRSQMAEAIARHHFSEWFEVASAGSVPHPIQPNTFRVIQELGMSTEGLYPKHVEVFRDRSFDYVVTLCDEAEACPLPPRHSHLIKAAAPDPICAKGSSAKVLDFYRKVRDQIRGRIFEIFHRILFRDGMKYWNEKRFWHAHEAWEGIWRTEEDPKVRAFIQGLIQLAAGLHHFHQGNVEGAQSMLQKSESHLQKSLPEHGGIHIRDLWQEVQEYLERPGQIDLPLLKEVRHSVGR